MVCFSMSLPHAVAAGGADPKSNYVDGSSSTAAISNESSSLNDIGSGCCHNSSNLKSSSGYNDLDDSSRPPRLCSLSQSMLSLSRRSGIASSASSATHTTGNSSQGYYSATTKHADNSSRLKICSASSVEDSNSVSSAARISRSSNIGCGPKTVDGVFGVSLSTASSKSPTFNKSDDKEDIERCKTNEKPKKLSRGEVQDDDKDYRCHGFKMMGLVQKRDDGNAEDKVPELMESPSNRHRRRRLTELIHVPPSETGSPALLFADDIIACTVTFPTVITLKTDDETNALCSLSSPSGLNDFLINNTHPENDDDACSYASDVSDVTSDLFQLRPSPSQRTRCESEEAKDDNEVIDVDRDIEKSRQNNDDEDSSVDASSQSSKSSKSTSLSIRSGSNSSILSSNDSESILFSSVEGSDNDDDHHRRRHGAKSATMESLALDKKFRLREKQLRRVSSGNKAYCAYLRKQEEKVRLMETSRLMMRHSMSFGANECEASDGSRRSKMIMSASQRRMSESHLFLGRVATNVFHSSRDLGNTVSNLLDLSGASSLRRRNTANTINQLSDIASSSEELSKEEEEEVKHSTNAATDADAGEKKTLFSLVSSLRRLLLLWMISFFQGLSIVVSRQYRNIVDVYQFERYHTFPGICAITLYCIAHTSIYNSITSLHGFIFSPSDSPHPSYEYFVMFLTFCFGVGLCRICGGIFNWLSDTMYEGVKFDLHNRFRLGLLDAKLTSWIRKRRMLCQSMDLLGFYLCFLVVSRLIEDHMMPYVCHSPAKGMHLLEELPSRNKDNLSMILQQQIPGWVHDDYDAIIKQKVITPSDPALSPTATAAMVSKSSKEWQSLFSTYFSDVTATSTVQSNSCNVADPTVTAHSMDDNFCSELIDEEDEEDEEDLDDDDDEEEQTLEQVQQLLDEADMEYLYKKLSTYSFTAMYGWGADIVPLVTQQRYAIYYVILSAISVAALVYMGVGFSME